jgi:ankyrin repeat protein
MRYLMEAKCNVNEKDNDGRTPLFFAALGGNVESLQFLIDSRADTNVRSEPLGETILFDAIRSKNVAMVECVLKLSTNEAVDLNAENNKQSTPLLEAMAYDEKTQGSAPILQLLVARGAKINARIGPSKKTPLFFAETPGLMQTLITLEADVHAADVNGRTPIFDCVLRNQTDTLDIIVGCNAQINLRDNDGRTPVFLCMEDEEFNPMLQSLIDYGADLNATDNQGQTPITLAKSSKKRKNVQQFITQLKKGIVKPVKGQPNTKGQKKTATGTNWAVRLTAMEKLDGRMQHCVVTFYDVDNPDTIIPYASEQYKQHWSDLVRANPDTLGMLPYPENHPWTSGPPTAPP